METAQGGASKPIDALDMRVLVLKGILDKITFENRSKYKLDVRKGYGSRPLILECIRNVPHSKTLELTDVNNSKLMPRDITDDGFVKLVFVAVGQFEAHEFAETFRYGDKHAYFPHDAKKGHALYGQGERINKIMLDSFRDIGEERHDLAIAFRYGMRGLAALPVIRHLIAFDAYMVSKARELNYRAKRACSNFAWELKLKFISLKSNIKNSTVIQSPLTYTFTIGMKQDKTDEK